MYFMARLSLESGSLVDGLRLQLELVELQRRAARYDTQFVRSFDYAGRRDGDRLLIAYPLAYAIAFRGGQLEERCCCSR